MKCPSCGNENKNTNIKCEVCGETLHQEEEKKYNDRKRLGCFSNVIITIVMIPWILAGLAFIGISLYSIMHNNKISKDYKEAEGTLVDYAVSRDLEGKEEYKAIYEFEADGVKYNASPDKVGSKSSFKKKAKVKYNPEYPNENIMASGWGGLLLTGIVMEFVIIGIVFFIKCKLKKISESIPELQNENDETKQEN